ncbi:J domain-containing protein [Neisseria leonii]|uniref:J domain-containing protein n=1 Tax=Neisseria leonii TaxID=2995413 RepID=UPI00237C1396|nr:J domain-containing protein [Neisseria sp. 3986]MDD9325081.1 J domain-containing protein [Neisseria sp. 3986]
MMAKRLHTHYDNLKVPPDASAKEIRAAYRALCRQYHPDRNPGHPQAERIMSIVNRSYAVLSDETARQKHDAWIAAHRRPAPPPRIASPMPGGFRRAHEPLPWKRIAVWLAVLAVLLLLSAVYTEHLYFSA